MNEGWQFWKWLAGGVIGIALAAPAVAAPPPNRGALLSRRAGDSNTGRLGGFRTSADRPLSRLDLRAPADLPAPAAAEKNHGLAADGPPFPTMRRTGDDNTSRADTMRARLEEDLPSVGSDGTAVRPASRAEEMARRFRREGLPIARLFESRSALVSLGLNQRGKPGIWLIQKVP
jgi:hypothetical protein